MEAARPQAVADSRIVDFRAEPPKVVVGEPVTVSGMLQQHTPILCFWSPLEGAAVEIFVDGERIATVTAGSGGFFRYVWHPRRVGVYRVRARFPGDIFRRPATAEARVEVVTREQMERDRTLMIAGIGGVVVLAAGLLIALARWGRWS